MTTRSLCYLITALTVSLSTAQAGTGTIHSDTKAIEQWLKQDLEPETRLLEQIRHSLASGAAITIEGGPTINFDPAVSVVGITLFQNGQKPLRYLSRRKTLRQTLDRVVAGLRARERFGNFEASDSRKTRILLEVIQEEQPVQLDNLTFTEFKASRFEPGITGLRLRHENGTPVYYMPTDAAVYSHMNRKQVFNAIAKKTPIGKQTNSISKRLALLSKQPYEYFLTRSIAYVTYGKDVVALYRGYPVPVDVTRQSLKEKSRNSVDWLIENMADDGRFLYYYDGTRDTVVDHNHPGREPENLYYNSLRHSGGTITLLRMYELSGDKKYLDAARSSIRFITDNLKERDVEGKKAYYLYYNRKSKLGGTGIALVAMARYYMLSGDNSYHETMAGMARHLVSRIDTKGEFIGYYIHPSFNDGKPIISPSVADKKLLFSFYYPGEALMGLALYTREVATSAQEIQTIKQASERALDWLVDTRPKEYPDLFLSLPADGWLMQAIEEWSVDPEFHKQSYIDFVFRDAKQMLHQMYDKQNSPYYDYPGNFYYTYGDHGYADGARAEGLMAAYYMAQRIGDKEIVTTLAEGIHTIAGALVFNYNSPESTYMYLYPEKAIGAFRFKYTRHWMRVDSVQHTTCFYIRMLLAPSLFEGGIKQGEERELRALRNHEEPKGLIH
jgi:hypothetical protein